jgi:predicted ATP-dependent serine protease
VTGAERRLAESAKLGFRVAIMPNGSRERTSFRDLECKTARTLAEAIALALD